MTDITEQDLRHYREEAERSQDEPLSGTATRPGRQRAKVLSVRLAPEELDEVSGLRTVRLGAPTTMGDVRSLEDEE